MGLESPLLHEKRNSRTLTDQGDAGGHSPAQPLPTIRGRSRLCQCHPCPQLKSCRRSESVTSSSLKLQLQLLVNSMFNVLYMLENEAKIPPLLSKKICDVYSFLCHAQPGYTSKSIRMQLSTPRSKGCFTKDSTVLDKC